MKFGLNCHTAKATNFKIQNGRVFCQSAQVIMGYIVFASRGLTCMLTPTLS